MNDPATIEIWQTVFGKDFGSMAQGDNKMGQHGTNSIFVMTHAEILFIPADCTITYARVVIDFHPQNLIRIEFGSRQGATSSTTQVSSQLRLQTSPHQN